MKQQTVLLLLFLRKQDGYLLQDVYKRQEPKDTVLPVGATRFPLWYHMEREMQCVDLPRQIHEGTPYPVKALFAMGLNYRILPDDQYFNCLLYTSTAILVNAGCSPAEL